VTAGGGSRLPLAGMARNDETGCDEALDRSA